MAQTVGDFIISRLYVWEVRRMFGYPGEGINGVFGAMNRASDKIEFIQARHEEMASFRRAYWPEGEFLSSPKTLAWWDEALASDRPVLLEVKTDPEVPPFPPHLTFEQVKNLSSTLIKGDPNQAGVIGGVVKQVMNSVLPRKSK